LRWLLKCGKPDRERQKPVEQKKYIVHARSSFFFRTKKQVSMFGSLLHGVEEEN
jgi:hypothetical protein